MRAPAPLSADLQTIAQAAADRAAEAVASRILSQGQIEEITRRSAQSAAESAIDGFMLKIGLKPDDTVGLSKDLAWVRTKREIGEAVTKQGLGFVIISLIASAGTAIVFWVRSGAPGR